MGWLTKCIVKFWEAWASAKDLVVEVAIAFITPQSCHIVHFSDSLLVKHCQILMRLFKLRIRTRLVVVFYPYANWPLCTGQNLLVCILTAHKWVCHVCIHTFSGTKLAKIDCQTFLHTPEVVKSVQNLRFVVSWTDEAQRVKGSEQVLWAVAETGTSRCRGDFFRFLLKARILHPS